LFGYEGIPEESSITKDCSLTTAWTVAALIIVPLYSVAALRHGRRYTENNHESNNRAPASCLGLRSRDFNNEARSNSGDLLLRVVTWNIRAVSLEN